MMWFHVCKYFSHELPLEVALLTGSVEQSFAIAANADARLSELMTS